MDFINKKTSWLFFILIIIGGCSSQNTIKKGVKKVPSCQLVEVEVEILIDSFPPYWLGDYRLFKSSNKGLEVFHLLVRSGAKKSILQQMTLMENGSIKLIKTNSEIKLTKIITDNKLIAFVKKESSAINYQSYFSNCSNFRSSPFYHTYLIKVKGKVVFKLNLDSVEIANLSEETKSKAINAFNVLELLQNLTVENFDNHDD